MPVSESPISRFHEEVDRLFERFFREPFLGESRLLPELRSWTTAWSPSLDVKESEDEITVRAELPGVDPKEIDISLHGDVLNISGEKREESEERREGYYDTERRFGSFRRSIALPAEVDQEKISAEYDKGVLTVKLQKSGRTAAKRIPVTVSRK
ncbi:MAG: hypothetical protein AMS25_02075 [Gemmatimonas sp. SM23_52]|nr:MAG: hypothetical protein AMS25_02075 [Gemmatimonas sp. SM23_52]